MMEIKEVDTVGRDLIRAIKPGTTEYFRVPSRAKCESARTSVGLVRAIDGTDYKVSVDYTTVTVGITRIK